MNHKPCPWCGDIPHCGTSRFGWPYVIVGCENDHCEIQPAVSAKTLKEAFAKWDTRHNETITDPDLKLSEPRGIL